MEHEPHPGEVKRSVLAKHSGLAAQELLRQQKASAELREPEQETELSNLPSKAGRVYWLLFTLFNSSYEVRLSTQTHTASYDSLREDPNSWWIQIRASATYMLSSEQHQSLELLSYKLQAKDLEQYGKKGAAVGLTGAAEEVLTRMCAALGLEVKEP